MKSKVYSNIGENVFWGKTGNGLRVCVVKKPGYAKKYAYFATNYGGADRRFKYSGKWTDTPAGVAHFLEHKMFDMPYGNALNRLSENGASPNAYTSLDLTAYHFECVEKFEENLKILLNFVTTPYFTEESVRKEQGIIGQEIGMINDTPSTEMYYGLLRCLYRENPIRYNIAGTVESISEITPDVLNKCHRVFYNPGNMILCVVGDVDENEVFKIASEEVTSPEGEVPQRDYGSDDAKYPFERHFEKNMMVSAPIFMSGSKCDIKSGGEEYIKSLYIGQLSVNLLMGNSSPLYERMYSSGIINSSFLSEFESVAGASYIAFGGESGNYERVIEEVCLEAERIAADGFDRAYFDRAKKAMLGQEIRGLNGFDNICYNVAKGAFNGYDPFESVGAVKNVDESDVLDFIGKYFSGDVLASSVIKPVER